MSINDGHLAVTGSPVTGFKVEVWPADGSDPVSVPAGKVQIACVRRQGQFPLPQAVPGDGSFVCPACAKQPAADLDPEG
jgi:hypothetical protein